MYKYSYFLAIIAVFVIVACSTVNKENNNQAMAPDSNIGGETIYEITDKNYIGDGGRGISLAVLMPTSNSINKDEQWILALIQGCLTSNFNNYSALTIVDRQNLDKILDNQQESLLGNFSDNDYIKIGNIINANYLLTGSLIKISNKDYILELSISNSETGERATSFAPTTCELNEILNLSILNKATYELLTRMGILISEKGRFSLLNTPIKNNIDSETALAKGITAERNGTLVEAISYYQKAIDFNPKLLEANARLSILSSDIQSGNISQNIKNDIQRRRIWINLLDEANSFYRSHLPWEIVYNNKSNIENINYNAETVDLSFDIFIWPTKDIVIIRDIQSGLENTKKEGDWGLKWEPIDYSFNITASLISKAGEIISKYQGVLGRTNKYVSIKNRIYFYNIHIEDIDKDLILKIDSINGKESPELDNNEYISVITIDEFNNKNNILMGNTWGNSNLRLEDFEFDYEKFEIIQYHGSNENLVIPNYINSVPVLSIDGFSRKNIKSVTFLEGITKINASAFDSCLLENIILPESLIEIGNFSFQNNKIKKVIIPQNVKKVGGNAFKGNVLNYLENRSYDIILGEGELGWFDRYYIYNNDYHYNFNRGVYVKKRGPDPHALSKPESDLFWQVHWYKIQ
jgi:tetratricopeptide (TPR) repeat protein